MRGEKKKKKRLVSEFLSVTNYIAEISFSPAENKFAYSWKRAVICNVEALRNIFSIFIISIGNSMVSSAIWKKHARVRFSKTIKIA